MNHNYEKLLDYIKEKPEVYRESSSAFWDDDHISKHMLADRGFSVTGMDLSRRSVRYAVQQAEAHHKNIKYLCQNYLTMDYENEFDVVTLIYCDFGVLRPDDRNLLLGKVKKALKPDGILFLDGFTEKFLETFEAAETIQYLEDGFWSPVPHAVLQRNSIYHVTANTLEQYIVITGQDCACYNMWNQMYSETTLKSELEDAGFQRVIFFDDVAGKEFTGTAQTICAVVGK